MKQKLSKTNRKAAAAFLLCTSLVAGHPFTSFASDESHAILMTQQQQQAIQGTVKTATGEPIIGANVREQGKPANGTITDLEGNFKLKVTPGATLEVTYIGYKTIILKATPDKPMEITLEEDSKNLDEVVVVGFGTQKKVNLTGSVGTATAKDLEARPVANAVQALQGVIPGLNISNSGNGGELNASKSIDVRGIGTIGTGSSGSPLILIDGMEGSLNNLNPQDIESISVLKDAAASSIYGSRAPFGVVLVTTKNGKNGRAEINYNASFRFNTPVKLPRMANSWEFVNLFDDAQFNGTGNHLFEESYRLQVYNYYAGKTDQIVWSSDGTGAGSGGKWNYDYTTANVNWLKEYYRNWSPSQEHNVSISGGRDNLTYYLSANYMTQEGFMRYGTDTYDRFTMSAKIKAQLTKVLKAEYSSRFVRNKYGRPTSMDDSFYDNVLRRARPVRAIYDPNGYLMSDLNYISALQEGGRYKTENDELTQQLRITLTPLKNWNIVGELNMRVNSNWTHWDQFKIYAHYKDNPENTYLSITGANKDQVYEYSYKPTYLNPTAYTNYQFTVGKHSMTALAGFQAELMKYKEISGQRTGLVSKDLPILNLTTDTDNYTLGGRKDDWSTAGFFGRVNYDYDGKYLFEANLRYDGSSRFRRDSRWVLTPSFSLGWNISREDFWEDLADYIETLKLRVSYGSLANQNTTSWHPTYQTLYTGTKEGTWLQGGSKTNVSYAPGLVSTSLTWEKISNTNLGVDFGVLNNRLTGSFDYFWRKTKDMVGPGVELPNTLGTAVPNTNNCDLTTFGWELQIGWRDKIGDFSYGVKLSLSDSQTRIDKYPNPTNNLGKYIAGQLTGDIYGYTTIGIAKTQEEMDAHLANLPNGGQTAFGSKWEAGDIMYADINGDGKIDWGSWTLDDMGDVKKIGNGTPRFRTGINLDASWKGIDLSMFWQGVLKQDFAPAPGSLVFWGVGGGGQWWSTSLKEHIDYFRPADSESSLGPNVDSYYPRPLFSNKNEQTQTRYLQDASYMRLKNLQVGYTFPKLLVNKIGLQNLRVYVSGENLLTFTNLSGVMDPETAGVGRQGGTVYPLSKTYSFGLSVNF